MKRRAAALLLLLIGLLAVGPASAQVNPWGSSGAPWTGPTMMPSAVPYAPGGRLTLCTQNPAYGPVPATPSSTDTTAESTTFLNLGWCTGTMVTPSATGGGLTAGTTYWVNVSSAVGSPTVVSYHTTLANAEAGTSKVNLTASITAEIRPFGIQSTTVRYTCFVHCWAPYWTGGKWQQAAIPSELSVAIGTLGSATIPVDVFLARVASGWTLELLQWSSATVPAANVTCREGPISTYTSPCTKTTDKTRQLVGTFYPVSTTVTEDSFGGVVSQVGGKRFLWNQHNRVRCAASVRDDTASWTYNGGFRQFNNAAGNKVEYVSGSPMPVAVDVIGEWYAAITAGISRLAMVGVGLDSTTARMGPAGRAYASSASATIDQADVLKASWRGVTSRGYHYLAAIETTLSLGTVQFTGGGSATGSSEAGLVAILEC